MAKKLQREFRNRPLTSDEVQKDAELRRKIEQEYRPKSTASAVQSDSMSDLLRRSIKDSGRTIEQLASDSGVSRMVIEEFISGTRDIHLATADRLARSVGLEVTAL